MKRFSSSQFSIFEFLLFPIVFPLIKGKRKWAIIYMLVFVVVCSGCFLNFYKTNTQRSLDNSSLTRLKNSDRYFIIHLQEGPFALKNIKVNNNLLEADLDSVSSDHRKHLYPDEEKKHTYKKKDEYNVLTEIHLYAERENVQVNHKLSIPISSIIRVDTYEKDVAKTRNNHILSSIGLIAGVAGGAYLIILIAVLIACNCPQVYVYDGEQYQFRSGVFSGAIYSSLEKTDYLPLNNIKAIDGKYKFRLMNNQQEEQFVNHLQLIQIKHDSSVHVLLDRHGIAHNYRNPIAPISTSLREFTTPVFDHRDGKSFLFNEKGDTASPFGCVILTFEQPENATGAKLIVNAKNSLWSGYLFSEFSSLFGSQYQKFVAKQDKRNKQQIEGWQKEQAIPLMVYVATDKGWQFVDYFGLTGNTAGRDMIIQLDLPSAKDRKIKIKLESAYLFWDVDYAALDFSADADLEPVVVNPSTAVQSNTSNEITSLTHKDDQYCKLYPNEFVTLEFDQPAEITGNQNSYFLVSTGYYHSLKQYTGKADLRKLYEFRKKGAFSEFSEKKFLEAEKMLAKGIDLPGRKH